MFIKFIHLYILFRHICHKGKTKMVWINQEGRMELCETGIDGFLIKIKPCHSTISGFVIDEGKDKNVK